MPQGNVILEGLPKGPELFIIAVCVNGDFLNKSVQGFEFFSLFMASHAHPLLALPDTGFHQTLNQRLAPQVAGHEFSQLLLKFLFGRKQVISFGNVDEYTAGFVIPPPPIRARQVL
ncbi:MAG: hypothetical protein ACLFPI_05940 [Desulfobacterales bacterium]